VLGCPKKDLLIYGLSWISFLITGLSTALIATITIEDVMEYFEVPSLNYFRILLLKID